MSAKKLYTLLILLTTGFQFPYAFGQCNNANAVENKLFPEKKALLDDAYLNKEYRQALAPLHWLLQETPQSTTSIYIKGAEILDALAQSEKDPNIKQKYIDSLMIVYDLRIKNCGEESNVMNRKAISFFKYNYNSPKAGEILPLMDKAIELNNGNVMMMILKNYMTVVKIMVVNHKALNDEQVMNYYNKITDVINERMKSGKDVDELKKILDQNLEIVLQLVNPSCDFVKNNLEPRLKEDSTNLSLAKQIFNFMLKAKCTDDPLWLKTGEMIFTIDKDFGLGKNLALRYYNMGNYAKAKQFCEMIAENTSVPDDNCELLLLHGAILEKEGNKPGARKMYQEAIRSNPSCTRAYEALGDLYYNSFDECAQGQFIADDHIIFLLAHDMYQKAGNGKKMDVAKSQFPSRTEIFERNYERGNKITVGCWINEETIIRTRD